MSHPSLTTFEIFYSFKSVEEEDLALGIAVMFIMSLLAVLLFGFQVFGSNDIISDLEDERSMGGRGRKPTLGLSKTSKSHE